MKRSEKLVCLVLSVCVFLLCSCVLTSAGVDSVSTMLSGVNKHGVPVKKHDSGSDPLLALTGETDVTLVGDFFPTALKLYEILHLQNPDHLGLAVMAGSLNIMYANAFVQLPADNLSNEYFDRQHAEYERAKIHYLRGRDLCIDFIEGRHHGFKNAVMHTDQQSIDEAVARLDRYDVDAAYWVGAGWLGAFSLDPLNPDMIGTLAVPVALLERAAVLNPDYSAGAIWDVLSNFYVSAPAEFGGDYNRGLYCHEQALRVSGGKTPGPYVTYAESVCIPSGDETGFESALKAALAINPDDDPSSRLMTTIMQQKARRLLENKDAYFVQW
jgi:predicted anti-sigma-YlaC factor YlaD